jgi:biopolymer transport protein ExbD
MRARRSFSVRGVTPLLDLLFILLFSLLALSDARKATATEPVRVRLPAVEPGEGEAPPDRPTIVIEIDAASRVRLAGHPEALDGPSALDALLAERIGRALPDEFEVEIQADANAKHGVSVALLQHLRRRGFAGVTLLALGDRNATWGDGER